MPRDFDRNDLSSLRNGRRGEEPADQGASDADELSVYEARDVYVSRDTSNTGRLGHAPADDAASDQDDPARLPYDTTVPPYGADVPPYGASIPPYGSTMPPASDVPYGYDGREGAYAGSPAPSTKRSSKLGWTILKVVGFLAAGYVGASLLFGVVLATVFAVGVSSCATSCSDNPIGDSRENAAFIANLDANDRDLVVFDALRGSIDSLTETLARRSDDPAMTADELRAAVARGSWPKNDVSEALSARVWVRIAELSQDWLESETGEQWEIVDFSYPFPDNGPVPVPAVRGEDDCCFCRLLCTQGDDQGLYVSVRYYRWAEAAYFEHTLDDSRAAALEQQQLVKELESTGLLGTRKWLMSDDDLLVWELGEDDELRDPATFVTTANELTSHMGVYRHVTLLKLDTPVVLGYNWLSTDYPNKKPLETVSFEDARQRLLMCDRALYHDHAAGDVLLDGCRKTDEEVTLESLSGTLSGNDDTSWRHPWRAPDETSVFDDELTSIAARELGVAEEQVIVASELSDADEFHNTMTTWVIVPNGTLPETPQAFCAQANALRDVFWEQVPRDDERTTTLYVHIFELDEATLRNPEGDKTSFAQVRAVAQARPADLEGYTFDVLLSVMPSISLWPDDIAARPYDVDPSDVSGSIARSRDWRYSDE